MSHFLLKWIFFLSFSSVLEIVCITTTDGSLQILVNFVLRCYMGNDCCTQIACFEAHEQNILINHMHAHKDSHRKLFLTHSNQNLCFYCDMVSYMIF